MPCPYAIQTGCHTTLSGHGIPPTLQWFDKIYFSLSPYAIQTYFFSLTGGVILCSISLGL
ncbi:hypothetical protein [Microseira wollei]|uniref:hypothetical protein n=1 Tax=Microseira wollei TaxID=467598 RepID=UPI001CFC84C5|nr:hypothetical protein [Microseira wollei]